MMTLFWKIAAVLMPMTAALGSTSPPLATADPAVESLIELWHREYAGANGFLERRAAFDRMMALSPAPIGVSIERVTIGTLGGTMVCASTPNSRKGKRIILYLHGGGFYSGSAQTHIGLAATLAKDAGSDVLLLDYDRVPEIHYPTPIDETVSAYQWLLAHGYNHRAIALAGESVGGNLVLESAIRIRDAGWPQPAALVALSPVADLAVTGKSMSELDASDPLIHRALLLKVAEAYLAGHSPTDPQASPVYADLSGLPPILIQVGGRETLLDDAVQLARNAAISQVPVTLEVWPDMIHQWQLFPGRLQQARDALADIAYFTTACFDNGAASAKLSSTPSSTLSGR